VELGSLASLLQEVHAAPITAATLAPLASAAPPGDGAAPPLGTAAAAASQPRALAQVQIQFSAIVAALCCCLMRMLTNFVLLFACTAAQQTQALQLVPAVLVWAAVRRHSAALSTGTAAQLLSTAQLAAKQAMARAEVPCIQTACFKLLKPLCLNSSQALHIYAFFATPYMVVLSPGTPPAAAPTAQPTRAPTRTPTPAPVVPATAAPVTASQPIAASGGACGSTAGNARCPSPQCCSQYGYCGLTTAHCTTGCQANFGTCNGGMYVHVLRLAGIVMLMLLHCRECSEL
jgi:Chitin recognition protein